MRTIDAIVNEVLGGDFKIDCFKIELLGKSDHDKPHFSGTGFIGGDVEGPFNFQLLNTLEKNPKELIRLLHATTDGSESMRFFAEDYSGTHWLGGWFIPKIDVSDNGRCIISGEFPQLSTRIKLTEFDILRNTTVNYYQGILRLPMTSEVRLQQIRDNRIESQRFRRDMCKFHFDGAEITVAIDEDKKRIKVSSTHRKGWTPPFCEVGLADSLAFVTATVIRPRITIRFFNEDALLFIRQTPKGSRTGMPRVLGTRDEAFWNIFLAFLKDCEIKQDFNSTPLAKMFSELVLASTGTIHGFILSLVVTIEEAVKQIVGENAKVPTAFPDLKQYIKNWPGDPELRESAIGLLSSSLSRVSTPQHLKQLIAKGVVTKEQCEIWKKLRPKVAHGKIVDYTDEQLLTKRNQLITMFYRLSLRLLKYQGYMTDYSSWPPTTYEFHWTE